ncbi:hypothetical protein [Mariniflexile sp.]
MKSKSIKKTTTLETFLNNEIKNPEVIVGGKSGPIIEKDKLKRPTCR